MLVHDAAESQQHQPVHSDESPALVGGQGLVVSWTTLSFLFCLFSVETFSYKPKGVHCLRSLEGFEIAVNFAEPQHQGDKRRTSQQCFSNFGVTKNVSTLGYHLMY